MANYNVSPKSKVATLLFCFFLGIFGVHRFYVGRNISAIFMLLTGGLCGIWTLVDFIVILFSNFKDGDGRTISE